VATQLDDPRKQEFLNYLLDPRASNCEETDETHDKCKGSMSEWGRRHNTHKQTLSRWKMDPVFRRAWDERIQEVAGGPERMQAMLNELARIGLRQVPGSRVADQIAAIKLHMEVTGRHKPTTKIEIDDPSLARAADGELIDKAAKRNARIRKLQKIENAQDHLVV